MKKEDHLPVFGIGPVCVYLMAALTLLGIILCRLGVLDSGSVPALKGPFRLLGAVLAGLGVFIWVRAVIGARIASEIRENHLVVTGIYAWVRNPIYSAIAIALTGICLFPANLWLLVLPPLFWGIITVMMVLTEEKWLRARFGAEYEAYCKRVNRCIPWPPKKG